VHYLFKGPKKAEIKIVYRLASCICAVLMLLACAFPSKAAETQSQYVLQINYAQDTNDGGSAPIKGAYFTIYQVADLTSKGYEYVEPYVSATKTALLDCGKEGSEIESLAYFLADVPNSSGQSGVTDDNGQLSVPAQAGAYLIVQTGTAAGSTAEQYIKASPFLVQVPGVDKNGLVNEKVIKAYPKTEKIKKNPEHPEDKITPRDETLTNPVPPQPSTPSSSVTQTVEEKKKNENSITSSSSNSNTTTTTTSNQPSNPITTIVRNFKTGDASRIGLMAIILGGCVAVIAILAVGAAKKKKKR